MPPVSGDWVHTEAVFARRLPPATAKSRLLDASELAALVPAPPLAAASVSSGRPRRRPAADKDSRLRDLRRRAQLDTPAAAARRVPDDAASSSSSSGGALELMGLSPYEFEAIATAWRDTRPAAEAVSERVFEAARSLDRSETASTRGDGAVSLADAASALESMPGARLSPHEVGRLVAAATASTARTVAVEGLAALAGAHCHRELAAFALAAASLLQHGSAHPPPAPAGAARPPAALGPLVSASVRASPAPAPAAAYMASTMPPLRPPAVPPTVRSTPRVLRPAAWEADRTGEAPAAPSLADLRAALAAAESNGRAFEEATREDVKWAMANCDTDTLSLRGQVFVKNDAVRRLVRCVAGVHGQRCARAWRQWRSWHALAAHADRVTLYVSYCSCVKIVAVLGGFQDRALADNLRRWRSACSEQRLGEREAAVLEVQRLVRGRLGRNKATRARAAHCFALLMRVVRAFLLRRRTQKKALLRRMTEAADRVRRRWLSRKAIRAAAIIADGIRRVLAAPVVQRVWRGAAGRARARVRRRARDERGAAVAVQRRLRGVAGRGAAAAARSLAVAVRVAVRLEARHRGRRGRRRAGARRKQRDAAFAMQRGWRCR